MLRLCVSNCGLHVDSAVCAGVLCVSEQLCACWGSSQACKVETTQCAGYLHATCKVLLREEGGVPIFLILFCMLPPVLHAHRLGA